MNSPTSWQFREFQNLTQPLPPQEIRSADSSFSLRLSKNWIVVIVKAESVSAGFLASPPVMRVDGDDFLVTDVPLFYNLYPRLLINLQNDSLQHIFIISKLFLISIQLLRTMAVTD